MLKNRCICNSSYYIYNSGRQGHLKTQPLHWFNSVVAKVSTSILWILGNLRTDQLARLANTDSITGSRNFVVVAVLFSTSHRSRSAGRHLQQTGTEYGHRYQQVRPRIWTLSTASLRRDLDIRFKSLIESIDETYCPRCAKSGVVWLGLQVNQLVLRWYSARGLNNFSMERW